jgi:hypothetical protein
MMHYDKAQALCGEDGAALAQLTSDGETQQVLVSQCGAREGDDSHV